MADGGLRAHRSDDDVLDQIVVALPGVEGAGAGLRLDGGESGVAKNLAIGQDPQQLQPLALESAPRELRDILQLVGSDLVQDDPDDLDTLPVKDRLVEIDLVNGFADAALADDHHFCAHDLGHMGIGEVENRPDPGVPGTFA